MLPDSIKAVIMEKCYVAFTTVLPDYECMRTAKVSVYDLAAENVAVQVRMWMLDGHKTDVRTEYGEILFPKTPWEFFKQEYMPEWFKRRWPVKFRNYRYATAVHHHYVCPHTFPGEEPFLHYHWMGQMSGQIPTGE